MNRLLYAVAWEEVFRKLGLAPGQVAAQINTRYGKSVVTTNDIEAFLKGETAPGVGLTKAVEFVFGYSFPAHYYGFAQREA